MITLWFRRFALAAAVVLALSPSGARAQQPSEAQLAQARELVATSDLVRPFESVLLGIADKLKSSVGPTRPEITKDFDVVIVEMKPYFDGLLTEIGKMAVTAIATRFTEDELKQINAFFKTPVGMKYAQAFPDAIDDLTTKFVAWGETKEREIIEKIRVELKKKGHNL